MNIQSCFAQQTDKAQLNWSTLAPVPDQIGFAGSFAGISNHALIVAGGANFPDGGAPWTGAVKVWTDKIFALDSTNGVWKEAGHLPFALGYGASVKYGDHFIILGGSNEAGHRAEVFKLIFENGKVRSERLADLPYPIANTAAVILDHTIYVTGGTKSPDAKTTAHQFWALDLSSADKKWEELPAWPGPSRMLHTMGTDGKSLFLFSGAELKEGNRIYLTDAYKYAIGQDWEKIADLPAAAVAAPGPAYLYQDRQLLVFGGDDGRLADKASALKERHPGFSTNVLGYDIDKNKWGNVTEIFTDIKQDASQHPNRSIWAPVTTTLTVWNGNIVIPGGEVRPAVRTPNVLMAKPAIQK